VRDVSKVERNRKRGESATIVRQGSRLANLQPRGTAQRRRYECLQGEFRRLLERVKQLPPLEEWLNAAPRSAAERRLYEYAAAIRTQLEREAQAPTPREITIRNGRLVSARW
jgi:hypothetical protein